ncbi:hypothetical protein EJD97_000528 [Solanum chilense]|uniref:Uncharacterized protein n=1 Tax=Solanum chilense TaxID=4083 RepID=A0A6N2CEA3_SOLCI|nr:hypothetical protein EJD97_000528 [Solanum chilense]
MEPTHDRVYVRGRSKFVAPSAPLVICFDDVRDPAYMTPGTDTPSRVARAARATPKKVVSSVVTYSLRTSIWLLRSFVVGESLGSAEVPSPTTAVQSALSDEDDCSESTPGSPPRALIPFLNDNGFMTRTLTLERLVLTGSLPTMTKIYNLFTRHRLEWTARSLGRYSEELAVMHERAFMVTTTYHFLCMICSLLRSAIVPIWHIDQLKTPLGTVYIGLIKDEANELDPHRGPRLELRPLGDNLADTVAQARRATQHASNSTNTTPIESIPGSSTAPSFSRSDPFPTLSFIAEAEERLERRMVQYTKRKIAKPVEDTMMAALFATFEIPPPPPRYHDKRRRGREEEESREQKKEHREMEAAREASLADEEMRRMRVVESAVGASCSRDVAIARGISNSAIADENTTEGV